jgi:uncharacterized membrane protein
MDETEQQKAFLTALTTEHFVLQASIGATLSEIQSRASMFIGALTGALVAMGFATQSNDIFLPFVATVLPAIFLLGVLTVLRLTDISAENADAEVGIARVRRKYRALGPEAEAFFQPKFGRWPESPVNPALRLGSFVAYWTSAASMIAAIDALVAAAGTALLLHLAAGIGLPLSIAIGAAVAIGLLVAFYQYQKLRIAELDRLATEATDELGHGSG